MDIVIPKALRLISACMGVSILIRSRWEIRVRVKDGIARVLFTVEAQEALLLHGFIKKSQRMPADELHTAQERLKQLRGARRRPV